MAEATLNLVFPSYWNGHLGSLAVGVEKKALVYAPVGRWTQDIQNVAKRTSLHTLFLSCTEHNCPWLRIWIHKFYLEEKLDPSLPRYWQKNMHKVKKGTMHAEQEEWSAICTEGSSSKGMPHTIMHLFNKVRQMQTQTRERWPGMSYEGIHSS